MAELQGKFITLEGPEGSGKSTQALMLAEYLSGRGDEVVKTREPGGVSIAEQLREMLLNPDNIICSKTELLLYAAGRAQHTEELILPALRQGKYVICERFTHATVAYQGYGRGLDMKLIEELNNVATGGIQPDITVILDVPADEGLNRVKKSNRSFDRLESENISFHRKVRAGYLELARLNGDIEVIESIGTPESVHEKIINLLEEKGIL
ncbi:MAG: dTMP kinase [Elusimicrobiota bacterium]